MSDESLTSQADIAGDGNVVGKHGQSHVVKTQIEGDVTGGLVVTAGRDVHIAVERSPTGAPFQAPPLPPHFIPRPEVNGAIKTRLLATEAAPGILVVSAIHGLGGIGKSVLAAAITHDPAVQQRFPDGILWAVLGQEPDLLSLLNGWIQALGDYVFHPTTVEAASTHLRTLLHDKAVLLVVDDVWDPTHALPFQVGSARCQALITTRRADVADEVGAELYRMNVMTEMQSLDLLSARLGHSLANAEREEASQVAQALGYLPLALELAAARVMRGTTWASLRCALEEEVARLEALESPHRRREGHLVLEATFNLSLNALRDEDEIAWQAFVWLGLLPEDVMVAALMAATLWECDEAEAADILELLWNDALLLLGAPIQVGEQTWPTYRVHDLLHDIARRLLTANQSQGLGLTLSKAHVELLERFRERTTDGLWHTLPNDGYIHTHLTWHMERAGCPNEIHALLREETTERRNGWHEARERLGQTAGYLEDVVRARRFAEEACSLADNAQVGQSVGLQNRYVLIFSSFNSLAQNIPPALMVALAKKGVWTPIQALAYAKRTPDTSPRVEMLVKLMPLLPDIERTRILQEVLVATKEAEFWLNNAQRQDRLVEILVALAPYLSNAQLLELLGIAQKLNGKGSLHIEALASLIPYLPAPLREHTLEETVTAVRCLKGTEHIRGLAILVPHLPAALREEVLHEALAANRSAWTIDMLAPHLPVELKEEMSRAVLRIVQEEIEEHYGRARNLAWLAPHLPAHLRRRTLLEALVTARKIEDEQARAEVLAELAPRLPRELREEVLQEALSLAIAAGKGCLVKEGYPGKISMVLIPHLPVSLLQRILTVWKIGDEVTRAETLVTLAPHLPVLLREEALHESLTTARGATDAESRARILTMSAPHLSAGLLREALIIAQEIENTECQVNALTGLVPHLPNGLREDVLQKILLAAREIKGEKEILISFREIVQWKALSSFLPHSLRSKALEEALAIARDHRDIEAYATVLISAFTEVPYPSRSVLWQEALDNQAMQPRESFLEGLRYIVPIIAAVGGPKALEETFHAIQDVGRWWP